MENRFIQDEFEYFLRKQTDDFKMMPSKKVWHGIYNNMHPGRRWPSVMMALVLISSLIFIGRLNTPNNSHVNNSYRENISEKKSSDKAISVTAKTDIKDKPVASVATIRFNNGISQKAIADIKTINGRVISNINQPSQDAGISFTTTPETKVSVVNSLADNSNDLNERQPDKVNSNSELIPETDKGNQENIIQDSKKESSILINPELTNARIIIGNEINSISKEKTLHNNNIQLSVNLASKEQTEQKTTTNQISLSSDKNVKELQTIVVNPRKKYKTTWTYFVGTAVANASLKGHPISTSNYTNTALAVFVPTNYKVLKHSAWGLESGIQMNYAFANNWKFTTGLHLVYSGYKIKSNEVHPTIATLILHDPESHVYYPKNYISHYGDGSGFAEVNIKNYSLQLSLPVGLQYQFFNDEKLQLSAVADVEPSMITSNYAYLLSSDGRYYVNDPSLMRKTNIASNFGVLFSFSSNKFLWQIGPDVRYQWFSSFKKDYTMKEHLINYGIRLGITPFRK